MWSFRQCVYEQEEAASHLNYVNAPFKSFLGWKSVSFIHQCQFQIGTYILLFLRAINFVCIMCVYHSPLINLTPPLQMLILSDICCTWLMMLFCCILSCDRPFLFHFIGNYDTFELLMISGCLLCCSFTEHLL